MVKDSDTNEETSRGVAVFVSLALYGNETTKDWCNMEDIHTAEVYAPTRAPKALWTKKGASQKDSIQCIAPLWK